LSNGGGVAPLVANGRAVAGYVSVGGWGRTWLEHMLELERERLKLSGRSPENINDDLKLFADLYVRYLVAGQKPGAIIEADARFKPIWYDKPDSQYGRPAAFYQQLQALNLEREWSRVKAPVLVVRGGYDWIMSERDAAAIADAVNRASAGRARFVTRPHMDHFLVLHDNYANSMNDNSEKFDDGVVTEVLAWLKGVALRRDAGVSDVPTARQDRR
jgi:pimeloyl-ACP methyl ester carboxylesterase